MISTGKLTSGRTRSYLTEPGLHRHTTSSIAGRARPTPCTWLTGKLKRIDLEPLNICGALYLFPLVQSDVKTQPYTTVQQTRRRM